MLATRTFQLQAAASKRVLPACLQQSRLFSSSRSAMADAQAATVNRLGVVGAGQMVRNNFDMPRNKTDSTDTSP
jgi:3-hydroxybutyryl-CoA dehydrogenase